MFKKNRRITRDKQGEREPWLWRKRLKAKKGLLEEREEGARKG